MRILLVAAALAAGVAASSPGWAQTVTATPAQPKVFHGQVQSLDGGLLTITSEGKAETFPLADKVLIILNRAGDLNSIKSGAYIATTNAQLPDGSGRSVSLSVYDPDMASAGVNYVMPTGNMMTNGTVAKVVRNPGASALEVDYGKGVRNVQVPEGSTIILASRGAPAALKPGAKVTVRAMPDEAGRLSVRFVSVGVDGFTPP